MLQPETLQFLTQLKQNNSKPWFDEHRKPYETAKADVVSLLNTVLTGLEQIDPALATSQLAAKSCLFRINRDVRFSANKSPYKTCFGAWFNVGGKKSPAAGYYVHLEPGNSFVAAGVYAPEPPVLTTIRQEIDYNFPAFEAIVANPAFTKYYAGLSTENALVNAPKGYKVDNPALNYLKLKSFTASCALSDSLLRSPKLAPTVLNAFAAIQPLVAFLNRALLPG